MLALDAFWVHLSHEFVGSLRSFSTIFDDFFMVDVSLYCIWLMNPCSMRSPWFLWHQFYCHEFGLGLVEISCLVIVAYLFNPVALDALGRRFPCCSPSFTG